MDFKIVITVLCCVVVLTEGATWDYSAEHGPSKWGDDYPTCNANSQSPIDVVGSVAEIDHDLDLVDRRLFWNPPTAMSIANNGHGLVFNIEGGAYEINNDKLLPFTAVLAQYHFHWASSKTTKGSEHLLNGTQFFGELHAVHFNKKYGDIGTAIDKSDGLAVFGWFIEVGYPQPNLDFSNFLTLALSGAKYGQNSTSIASLFSLETFLPPGLDVYYRYQGSLTTPPCHESVTWTVFQDPIYIHEDQAEILATMFYEDDGSKVMKNNYRPILPLNGRKITTPPRLVRSGASAVSPTIIASLLTCIIGYFM
ncbi:carbonic anhydrase-like [Styela clava]